ncbi:hypothetical protein Pyn_27868 [Prunus yedoensis var. nudiflora]|uniref:Uncharacterized protein n=1 Tax=Prunus yedoensis var. nudiflora TaxID=2094558 RepID=A0A314ZG83_PRUYE|nr:hypothetical protein Pyn_27868 [Prunus yedoensis var. nudiflora]
MPSSYNLISTSASHIQTLRQAARNISKSYSTLHQAAGIISKSASTFRQAAGDISTKHAATGRRTEYAPGTCSSGCFGPSPR